MASTQNSIMIDMGNLSDLLVVRITDRAGYIWLNFVQLVTPLARVSFSILQVLAFPSHVSAVFPIHEAALSSYPFLHHGDIPPHRDGFPRNRISVIGDHGPVRRGRDGPSRDRPRRFFRVLEGALLRGTPGIALHVFPGGAIARTREPSAELGQGVEQTLPDWRRHRAAGTDDAYAGFDEGPVPGHGHGPGEIGSVQREDGPDANATYRYSTGGFDGVSARTLEAGGKGGRCCNVHESKTHDGHQADFVGQADLDAPDRGDRQAPCDDVANETPDPEDHDEDAVDHPQDVDREVTVGCFSMSARPAGRRKSRLTEHPVGLVDEDSETKDTD
nr:hypothetical protein CFP56_42214 [Quercus suber]